MTTRKAKPDRAIARTKGASVVRAAGPLMPMALYGVLRELRGDRIGCIEAFETAVELAPTARNRSLLAAAREGRPL